MPFSAKYWLLMAIDLVASTGARAWYPETGRLIAGAGLYDRSSQVYLLIAFHKSSNCESASIYLDRAVGSGNNPDNEGQLTIDLTIDSNRASRITLTPVQLAHWMPHTEAMTSPVSGAVVQEIRWGNNLKIDAGVSSYSWSLRGSNEAIVTAYQLCNDRTD